MNESVTPTGKSQKNLVRRRLSASFSPVRKVAAPAPLSKKKAATTGNKEKSKENSPKRNTRKRKSSSEEGLVLLNPHF
jgi:hypothetical protein